MAEASTDEQKLSPAEKAKLAAAKKAEAAKKAGPVGDPLVDNEDGTITDPNSGLTWKKTDAWLDKKVFYRIFLIFIEFCRLLAYYLCLNLLFIRKLYNP